MIGYIHSEESFGTVDGPGIRYVLFMQGCPLRCIYCHNPDTWNTVSDRQITPEQVMEEYRKNRAFYEHGGITVSGGEPLLQIDFVTELFSLAKEEGIHTCIDTSGITYNSGSESCKAKFDKLMRFTDLVMLDIKHMDPEEHKKLTGAGNKNVLDFAKYLEVKGIPVWVRRVVIQGITDSPSELRSLGRFIGGLKNLQALDVIPYHTLGVSKYKDLGIPYPLEGAPAVSVDVAAKAKREIIQGIKEARALKLQ